MTRPLAILCALVLAAPTAIATAHAEEDCGDLGRNYQLIEREAVSVQTNMALISAADRGCEALARQLLDAGASLLARDRHMLDPARGAGPLGFLGRAVAAALGR